MYNGHFGFDTEPFRVTPDPRFLYLSDSHREALASLVYTVQQRKGFVVLTGEVGTGKTTILNAMLRRLEPGTQTAYLFNTALSVEDFFVYLFDDLELKPVDPFRKSDALHALNSYLIGRLRDGKQTVLIIDEAQNLSTELLEEIRMLSNLETPTSKLLQIILVGQPELGEKLRRGPSCGSCASAIELRHSEIDHHSMPAKRHRRVRARTADDRRPPDRRDLSRGPPLRDYPSVLSGGIPRIINVICAIMPCSLPTQRSARFGSPAQMVEEAAHGAGSGR